MNSKSKLQFKYCVKKSSKLFCFLSKFSPRDAHLLYLTEMIEEVILFSDSFKIKYDKNF